MLFVEDYFLKFYLILNVKKIFRQISENEICPMENNILIKFATIFMRIVAIVSY